MNQPIVLHLIKRNYNKRYFRAYHRESHTVVTQCTDTYIEKNDFVLNCFLWSMCREDAIQLISPSIGH